MGDGDGERMNIEGDEAADWTAMKNKVIGDGNIISLLFVWSALL